MKILIVAKQIEVTEDMRKLYDRKLAKFDKFFGKDTDAVITLSRTRNSEKLELTIKMGGTIFRAEESAQTFQIALDRVMDSVERQIRKNKTKLQKRYRDEAPVDTFIDAVAELPGDEDGAEIPEIRVKQFDLKPMTPEEAILQMDLLGHSFYVFMNEELEKVSVVYKRHDDTYGMIVPKGE